MGKIRARTPAKESSLYFLLQQKFSKPSSFLLKKIHFQQDEIAYPSSVETIAEVLLQSYKGEVISPYVRFQAEELSYTLTLTKEKNTSLVFVTPSAYQWQMTHYLTYRQHKKEQKKQ